MSVEETTQNLRSMTFVTVVFSTVAITGSLLTIPLIFQYAQTLESSVQIELEFCVVRFTYRLYKPHRI